MNIVESQCKPEDLDVGDIKLPESFGQGPSQAAGRFGKHYRVQKRGKKYVFLKKDRKEIVTEEAQLKDKRNAIKYKLSGSTSGKIDYGIIAMNTACMRAIESNEGKISETIYKLDKKLRKKHPSKKKKKKKKK